VWCGGQRNGRTRLFTGMLKRGFIQPTGAEARSGVMITSLENESIIGAQCAPYLTKLLSNKKLPRSLSELRFVV